MAETENELRQQEMERDSLQRTVSGLLGAIMYASGEHRAVIEAALRNATGHLATVEKRVKDLTTARETEVKEATTRAVLMAQQETRLNAHEKETFARFMTEGFFAKADFGRLEEFYLKAWDRLSERGKKGGAADGFVLIRALQPTRGIPLMRRRRFPGPASAKPRPVETLCSGPGKLTIAMGMDGRDHGLDLCENPARAFHILKKPPLARISDVRVGISKAAHFPWRFLAADNAFVSKAPAPR